jgi:hypothetical protein
MYGIEYRHPKECAWNDAVIFEDEGTAAGSEYA